jgi:hypothetical protein
VREDVEWLGDSAISERKENARERWEDHFALIITE